MRKIETGMYYPLELETLPKTWAVGYVGDFAIKIQPGFASGEHNQERAGIPHLRPMNIDRQGKIDFDVLKYVSPGKDTKRLYINDVLFNNTNSPALVGKTAVITKPGDWGFSNHMTRVVFPENILAKFAAYQLHFLWMTGYFLHKCVKHVNQASISSKELTKTVPFVVAPTYEQKHIVAEIEKQFSRLDEAVASLKRAKANLKRYKAAVLKAAVEGKLTAEWRKANPDVEPAEKLLKRILEERRRNWTGKGKYKEPAAPDTSNLPELPKGWVWATTDNLGDVIGGLTKNQKREKLPIKLPYLRVANVYANELRLEEIAEIGVDEKEIEKLLLQKGDLLIVEGNGSPDQIGRLAVWDGSINPCVHQNHLIKVRLSSACLPSWAVNWFLSPEGRTHIQDVASSTSGLYTLSVGKISALPIPLPPLEEQHQIIAEIERCLSVIIGAEIQIDINLRRADRLRQSILKQAFSGQLVPAISYEEPAGVLLDRVGPMQLVAPKAAIGGGRGSASPLRKTKTAATALGDFTSLDSILAAILNYMQTSREYSRAEIADALGLSTGRWNAAIQELKRRGKVRQIGERRGSRYRLI